MKTDRFTKSLLLTIACLLVGNLLATFGGISTPAYAKPGAVAVKYEIGTAESTDSKGVEPWLNQEAKKGWRLKATSGANGQYMFIMEK